MENHESFFEKDGTNSNDLIGEHLLASTSFDNISAGSSMPPPPLQLTADSFERYSPDKTAKQLTVQPKVFEETGNEETKNGPEDEIEFEVSLSEEDIGLLLAENLEDSPIQRSSKDSVEESGNGKELNQSRSEKQLFGHPPSPIKASKIRKIWWKIRSLLKKRGWDGRASIKITLVYPDGVKVRIDFNPFDTYSGDEIPPKLDNFDNGFNTSRGGETERQKNSAQSEGENDHPNSGSFVNYWGYFIVLPTLDTNGNLQVQRIAFAKKMSSGFYKPFWQQGDHVDTRVRMDSFGNVINPTNGQPIWPIPASIKKPIHTYFRFPDGNEVPRVFESGKDITDEVIKDIKSGNYGPVE